jgi:hypothetical protein
MALKISDIRANKENRDKRMKQVLTDKLIYSENWKRHFIKVNK